MKTYLPTLAATAALALPLALSSSCARHTKYEPGPAAIPRVNPEVARRLAYNATQVNPDRILLGAGDRFGDQVHRNFVLVMRENADAAYAKGNGLSSDSPEGNYAQITLNPEKEVSLSAEDKAAIEAAEAWLLPEVSHGVLSNGKADHISELGDILDDVHFVSYTKASTTTSEPVKWGMKNGVSYVLPTGFEELPDYERIMETYSTDDRQDSIENKPVVKTVRPSGPWVNDRLNELHHKGDTK